MFFFLWMSLFLDIIIVTHSFIYRFYKNLFFSVPMTACTMAVSGRNRKDIDRVSAVRSHHNGNSISNILSHQFAIQM